MQAFESCALPAAAFRHADHVKMAFLYLQKYPPLEALTRFSSAITKFATFHGKPDRYNETITCSFLLLIRERIARAGYPLNWSEFSAANADLLRWNDNILNKYYLPETLASELAKRVFLFPDKF
jgi:hypothetical protein